MAQLYPVVCDCGRTHQVPGTSAGSDLPCGCGRTVDIPSLHKLRSAAGESSTSPELMIEYLLLENRLPDETECVCCGAPTSDAAKFDVVCERIEVTGGRWKINVAALLVGWIYASREPGVQHGRNIAFRLPLRICRGCGKGLGRAGLRDAVRRVPVYAQLLDKYPWAKLSAFRF